MTEKRIMVGNMTVGELKKFLECVPDNTEIDVDSVGDTGFVDGVSLVLTTFEGESPMLSLEIKAESGFHY